MSLHQNPELTTLHKLMPELHESEKVQSSVRAHQRLEGSGTTQPRKREKALAEHVLRLQYTFESDDNHLRQRSWEAAVNALLITPDNIPESHWQQQTQIARDNGEGSIVLDDHIKAELTEQLRDAQRTGAESWAQHLEFDTLYPTWFKVYAWDGMSRLGVLDKKKGKYRKRDKTTVAPYPQLNIGTLMEVYEAVNTQLLHGETPDDEKISELVKNGNFNNLYSQFLLRTKATIETPQNPEDIHGTWKEYTSDDIEAITHAAEGTPWCIAGRYKAEHYTQHGGKFYLFHLIDAETGIQSETACASIRLDNDGTVAEISGLKSSSNDGPEQELEDALVPTVLEKVNTLPGGERYLQAFEDKQTLIAMDKKLQRGEDFSLEELEFLYEVERNIEFVGLYTRDDPRVEQFKNYHKDTQRTTMQVYYSPLDTTVLIDMTAEQVCANLSDLLEYCDDIELIVTKLPVCDIASNFSRFIEAGATIDLESLCKRFEPYEIIEHLPELIAAGMDIDIDQFVAGLDADTITSDLITLLDIGATIDASSLLNDLDSFTISWNLDRFLDPRAEVSIDNIVETLEDRDIAANILQLSEAGANIDIDSLVNRLDHYVIAPCLDRLLEAGASTDIVAKRLNRIEKNELSLLRRYGYTG